MFLLRPNYTDIAYYQSSTKLHKKANETLLRTGRGLSNTGRPIAENEETVGYIGNLRKFREVGL